jgi:DNA invertase Pin-like site-specific DNA recombinase
MKPFGAYVRVSRVNDREGDSFLSPKIQRETIDRLATAHGVEVAENAYVEELDVSGKKPIEERELGRLVRRVEDGDLGGILVWKVSRFSRDLLDCVTVADRIRDAGGVLIGGDLDMSAPMSRPILAFLAAWAEEEREERKRGWKAATDDAIERGLHLGAVPLGYERPVLGWRGEKAVYGPLVVREEEREAVVYAFRARARGDSWRTIADALRERYGIEGMTGNRVRSLISSRTYRGEVSQGQKVKTDAHPAIVDENLWQAAQIDGGRPKWDGTLAAAGILTKLCYCGGCGGLMKTHTGRGGLAAYTCKRRDCPARATINLTTLDAHVEPGILERIGQRSDIADVRRREREAKAEVERAEAELRAFVQHASAADLGELYATEIARRREDIRNAVRAWRDFQSGRTAEASLTFDPEDWPLIHIDDKRRVSRAVIDRIDVKRTSRGRWQPVEERVEVVWKD